MFEAGGRRAVLMFLATRLLSDRTFDTLIHKSRLFCDVAVLVMAKVVERVLRSLKVMAKVFFHYA